MYNYITIWYIIIIVFFMQKKIKIWYLMNKKVL